MSSHGKAEILRKNLEKQLDRLVDQLDDIEDSRSSITSDEYEKMKEETMEQMREFDERLRRMITGGTSLVDGELGAMRLATQSAISAACRTPAVIRMLAKRESECLRTRLDEIARHYKTGILNTVERDEQRAEVLNALKHLGEKLRPEEIDFLERFSLQDVTDGSFVPVTESSEKGEIALAIASNEIRATPDS